jgi:V/A-type H+/Na+-transporting ATPase subunit E
VAYENLLKSVGESAGEREQEIRTRARTAARAILEEAEARAKDLQQISLDEAKKAASVERNKQMYLAKVEEKKRLIARKEEIFSRAIITAEQRLSTLRTDPVYPDIFKKLAQEAAGAIETGKCHVHVDKRDEQLSLDTLAGLNLPAVVIPDLTTAGGLVITNPDETVTISNTVESRLERIKEHRKLEIYSILFGG